MTDQPSGESDFDPSKPLFKWWKATVSKDYTDHDTPTAPTPDQPSAPSVDALRRMYDGDQFDAATEEDAISQALAAYDLMSQRAERLEVCLMDSVTALAMFSRFMDLPIAKRAFDLRDAALINASKEGVKPTPPTVLSENKEEKL